MGKIGRNMPCPCGSGKKYKKCCHDPLKQQPKAVTGPFPGEFAQILRRQEAEELIRTQQQGLGRPIVSTVVAGSRVVAVKNSLFFSKKWRFFADFLGDYLLKVLGAGWISTELIKPLADRHPIIEWFEGCRTFLRSVEPNPDGTYRAVATGVVNCYLGLAYGLYLLAHNVELQDRLVARLKDPKNFQGAYYEVIVANVLVRAGFELELEDETDPSQKHCEFSAASKKTGRRYWVEAKMHSVAGLMGKTAKDGSKPGAKPTSRLSKHLREALRKPAANERLIFIDVNAPDTCPNPVPGSDEQPMTDWMRASIRQLEDREKDLKDGEAAYVFVTNFPFHRHLNVEVPTHAALAHGLGMDDFGKPGERTLTEIWKNKQKHIDAHTVFDALRSYPSLPTTFDGALPLTSESAQNQISIGNTYLFEESNGGGVIGTVTAATMSPEERKMYIAITTANGASQIRTRKISDEELDTYQRHPEAYFGEVSKSGGSKDDPYELFEWFVDCYKDTPRVRLLKLAEAHPDFERLEQLDEMELRFALCEGWVASAMR